MTTTPATTISPAIGSQFALSLLLRIVDDLGVDKDTESLTKEVEEALWFMLDNHVVKCGFQGVAPSSGEHVEYWFPTKIGLELVQTHRHLV
jgi:hypothetical protein